MDYGHLYKTLCGIGAADDQTAKRFLENSDNICNNSRTNSQILTLSTGYIIDPLITGATRPISYKTLTCILQIIHLFQQI